MHVRTAHGPFSSAVADFNGDGQSDLAILLMEYTGYVFVLLGNGNGTFKSEIKLSEEAFYYSIAAGDFNNDTNVDLIFSDSEKYHADVWFGNGNGTF
jgi:hypothetical protein